MRKLLATLPLIAAATLGACGDDPPATDGDTLKDAGGPLCFRPLDLLFVIDETVAKKAIHDRLYVAIPRFLAGLSTGDLNHDGTAELVPFTDIHVGVVTADLGVYAEGNPYCSAMGRDGILLDESTSGACKGGGYPYQIYVPSDESKPDSLIEQTQCLAQVGLQKCTYEQPLEAMYKAIAPDTVSFHGGTKGHGTLENKGFLRENSVLAVVHLTDEDDCSVSESGVVMFDSATMDPRLKSPDSDKPLGTGLRCALSAAKQAKEPALDLLQPVSRFVDGLKALKPNHPERIVFGVIAGIPWDAEGQAPADLLARSELNPTPYIPEGLTEPGSDPLVIDQTQLVPACEDVSKVSAAPAPRLVETAKGFGENGVVGSVCAATYDKLLDAMATRISAQLEVCQCNPDLAADAGGCPDQ